MKTNAPKPRAFLVANPYLIDAPTIARTGAAAVKLQAVRLARSIYGRTGRLIRCASEDGHVYRVRIGGNGRAHGFVSHVIPAN